MKKFDIFSFNPNLCFNGEYRYRSCTGLIISLFFYISLISLISILLNNYIEGKEMSIIQSDYVGYNNKVELTDDLVLVRILDEFYHPVPTTYIKPFFSLVYNLNGTSKTFLYNMKKCEEKDFKNANNIGVDINTYFCINSSALEYKSIELSDELILQSYVNIYVSYCDSKSIMNNENCLSKNESEKYKENILFLDYYIRNDYAEHNNRKNPIKKSYKMHSLLINKGIYYVSVTLQKIVYYSDEGFMFESNKKYEGLKEGKKEVSFIEEPYYSPIIGNIHTNLEILPSLIPALQYQRSYQKLQNTLAFFGGFFNVILYFCNLLSFFLTRGLFFRDIFLLSFQSSYFSNKKSAADEFNFFIDSKFDKLERSYHRIKIKKSNAQLNSDNKFKNYVDNINDSIYNKKHNRIVISSHNLTYNAAINKKKDREKFKNSIREISLQNSYSLINKSNIKIFPDFHFDYKNINNISPIDYLKSIFCKCYPSKNLFIFDKLKKIICLFLSSDELVYNYMRYLTLAEYFHKDNEND